MDVNMPACDLRTCMYYCDGNCTQHQRYESCSYPKAMRALDAVVEFNDVVEKLKKQSKQADMCSCWRHGEEFSYCMGTKEMDVCDCNGHVSRCTFYGEKESQNATEVEREPETIQICRYIIQHADVVEHPVNCARLIRILFLLYCDWEKEFHEPLFPCRFEFKNGNPTCVPALIAYIGNGSLRLHDAGSTPLKIVDMPIKQRRRLDELIEKWCVMMLSQLYKATNNNSVIQAARNDKMAVIDDEFVCAHV